MTQQTNSFELGLRYISNSYGEQLGCPFYNWFYKTFNWDFSHILSCKDFGEETIYRALKWLFQPTQLLKNKNHKLNT